MENFPCFSIFHFSKAIFSIFSKTPQSLTKYGFAIHLPFFPILEKVVFPFSEEEKVGKFSKFPWKKKSIPLKGDRETFSKVKREKSVGG